MAELVRFALGETSSVIFEIDESEQGIGQVGRHDGKVRDLPTAFEDRLSAIHDAAAKTLAVLRGNLDPHEVRLTFGIKMTAEAGAVIARTAIEGNLGVEMLWKRDSARPSTVHPGASP